MSFQRIKHVCLLIAFLLTWYSLETARAAVVGLPGDFTFMALQDLDQALTLLKHSSTVSPATEDKYAAMSEISAAEEHLQQGGSNPAFPHVSPGVLAPHQAIPVDQETQNNLQNAVRLLNRALLNVLQDANLSGLPMKTTIIKDINYAIRNINILLSPSKIYIAPDSEGIQHFMLNGTVFTPVCVNYLDEATTPYKTFDMFDTNTFNLQAIDQNMQGIASKGFNCVRIWLKGVNTDNGFSSTPNGGFDVNVWTQYVKNVDAVLQSARRNNIRVILTGCFPGPHATSENTNEIYMPLNYLPPASTLPSTKIVNGFNRLILIPEMTDALARFYTDFLNLLVYIDPKVDEGLLYFDLYNEMRYDLLQPPFSQSSGVFTFKNTTYNLADPVSRQALMDAATTHFMTMLSGAVKQIIPDLLVTASSGLNLEANHTGFNGGIPSGKNPDSLMLRPAYELAAGADIIDIHLYPGPAYPQYNLPPFHERAVAYFASDEIFEVQVPPTGTSVNAKDAVIFAGEFGAALPKFGVTASQYNASGTLNPLFQEQYTLGLPKAISEMTSTEQDILCAFNFSGFSIWDWGNNTNTTPATFNIMSAYDPNGLFSQAFSPINNSVFCGNAIN